MFVSNLRMGLFEKWSTFDTRNVYASSFQKLVFLVYLYPKFLGKKNQRNKKKLNFDKFSFYANLMLDGKHIN